MDLDMAKRAILRDINHGMIYPFQSNLKNNLDEKARRYLKCSEEGIKFDQTQLEQIPYIYRHEVRMCYYHGEFFAVIAFSGAVVDYILRTELEKNGVEVPWGFEGVINECGEKNIITEDLVIDAKRVKELRDLIIHPHGEDWDELMTKIRNNPEVPQIEEIATEIMGKMGNILGHFYPY